MIDISVGVDSQETCSHFLLHCEVKTGGNDEEEVDMKNQSSPIHFIDIARFK